MLQTTREYNFVQSMSFAVGSGLGFALALVIMSGIREKIVTNDVPSIARGAALVLFIAGILSMAFMGFTGLGG